MSMYKLLMTSLSCAVQCQSVSSSRLTLTDYLHRRELTRPSLRRRSVVDVEEARKLLGGGQEVWSKLSTGARLSTGLVDLRARPQQHQTEFQSAPSAYHVHFFAISKTIATFTCLLDLMALRLRRAVQGLTKWRKAQ